MRYPRPFHRSAAGKLPLGHTTVAQSKGAGKPPRKGPKLASWPTREREAYGYPRTQNRSLSGPANSLGRQEKDNVFNGGCWVYNRCCAGYEKGILLEMSSNRRNVMAHSTRTGFFG